MCFQFEFQRRYKLSGAGMVTDMTLLQNAEFKEAFDEFDKVLCSSSSNTIENNTVLDGCSTVVL